MYDSDFALVIQFGYLITLWTVGRKVKLRVTVQIIIIQYLYCCSSPPFQFL